MVGLSKTAGPCSPQEDTQLFIVSRKQWNAHPPAEGIPEMRIPIGNVRFTHTATAPCGTFDECKRGLKKLQFEHMDTLGHKDICHNFIIGGQGWIFEGRGWNFEPDLPTTHYDPLNQSLEVAYMGDYEDEAPPPELLRAGMELLIYATRRHLFFHFFEGCHLT